MRTPGKKLLYMCINIAQGLFVLSLTLKADSPSSYLLIGGHRAFLWEKAERR